MESKYRAIRHEGFLSALKSNVEGNKAKSVIDLQNIFLRLVMIGQRRKMELEPLFDYELCSVPSSLIDEHGCLRKWNKSGLVKRVGVLEILPVPADMLLLRFPSYSTILCGHMVAVLPIL